MYRIVKRDNYENPKIELYDFPSASSPIALNPFEELEGSMVQEGIDISQEQGKKHEEETFEAERDQLRQESIAKGYEEGKIKGHAEGYEVGYAIGLQEAKESQKKALEGLQEKIANCIEDMEEQRELYLESYLDDLKNISLAVGEKIVQTSLKSSESVIQRMILAATDKLKKVVWAKVYIGTGGVAMQVQGDSQFIGSLSKLAESVKVILMDEEPLGICIIEMPDEVIDISVETQIEAIRDIVNDARM